MLKLIIDDTKFNKDVKNIIQYSLGFFDGVKQGVPEFLRNASRSMIDSLKEYIDSNARVTPQLLHHMYEWGQTGASNARLFDIQALPTGNTVSFISSFRQSATIKKGSSVPFFDKARIMEYGIPVTIVPKRKVLSFEIDGEQIFTPNPVTVTNPGGNVSGEYERIFNSFFNSYFAQSYLESSGILAYLSSPTDFYRNMSERAGRSHGFSTGKNWIAKAGRL